MSKKHHVNAFFHEANRIRDWWADKGCVQHSNLLCEEIRVALVKAHRSDKRATARKAKARK